MKIQKKNSFVNIVFPGNWKIRESRDLALCGNFHDFGGTLGARIRCFGFGDIYETPNLVHILVRVRVN